jgi:hypothetical protein
MGCLSPAAASTHLFVGPSQCSKGRRPNMVIDRTVSTVRPWITRRQLLTLRYTPGSKSRVLVDRLASFGLLCNRYVRYRGKRAGVAVRIARQSVYQHDPILNLGRLPSAFHCSMKPRSLCQRIRSSVLSKIDCSSSFSSLKVAC